MWSLPTERELGFRNFAMSFKYPRYLLQTVPVIIQSRHECTIGTNINNTLQFYRREHVFP